MTRQVSGFQSFKGRRRGMLAAPRLEIQNLESLQRWNLARQCSSLIDKRQTLDDNNRNQHD
jgi:hypothetical protein